MTKNYLALPEARAWPRSCRGKRPYVSRRRAAGAARVLARQNGEDPAVYNEYKCATCKRWHIGHKASHRRTETRGTWG